MVITAGKVPSHRAAARGTRCDEPVGIGRGGHRKTNECPRCPERGLRNLRNLLVDTGRLTGWRALRVSGAASERS